MFSTQHTHLITFIPMKNLDLSFPSDQSDTIMVKEVWRQDDVGSYIRFRDRYIRAGIID